MTYQEIVDEHNLGRLLEALNDQCGTGSPMALSLAQDLRKLVENLKREKWLIASKSFKWRA